MICGRPSVQLPGVGGVDGKLGHCTGACVISLRFLTFGDFNLWPIDLEIGIYFTPALGNVCTNFGLSTPLYFSSLQPARGTRRMVKMCRSNMLPIGQELAVKLRSLLCDIFMHLVAVVWLTLVSVTSCSVCICLSVCLSQCTLVCARMGLCLEVYTVHTGWPKKYKPPIVGISASNIGRFSKCANPPPSSKFVYKFKVIIQVSTT